MKKLLNNNNEVSFEHIENPTIEEKSVKDVKKNYDEYQAPLVKHLVLLLNMSQSNDVVGNSRKVLKFVDSYIHFGRPVYNHKF